VLALERRKRQRRGIAAAVGVATVALVLSELLIEPVQGFWVEHPITAALVGFAVTLALTALVVDELLERRAAERWSSLPTAR
jgi:hypothetical protein